MAQRKMSLVDEAPKQAPTPSKDAYETCIKPCGHRVLILPDEIPEQCGSLVLPQIAREREQYAQIFGTVIDVGPTAWKAFDDGTPWAKIGDHVAISKYGGFIIRDQKTRKQYRLINDEDVTCVIAADATPELVEEA